MTGLTAGSCSGGRAPCVRVAHRVEENTVRGGYSERPLHAVDCWSCWCAELLRQGVLGAQLGASSKPSRPSRVRLFETIGGGGPLTLPRTARVYGRTGTASCSTCCGTRSSRCSCSQDVEGLRELGTARVKGRRTTKRADGRNTKVTKTQRHKAE